MIACLRGKLIISEFTSVVIDVNGVGYRVFIPMSTFDRMPKVGEEVTLLTYTHVREDTLHLYGFATSDEKLLFEQLISVSGIGTKVALNILSCTSVANFCDAVVNNDLKSITCINGIGKKTAERLVLELKDKLAKLAPEIEGTQAEQAVTEDSPAATDAILALEQLGFKREKAEATVRKIAKGIDAAEQTSENFIRLALQALNS